MPNQKKSEADSGGGVRSVERAISILEAFTAHKASMSVIEIQELVHLSRPTLYRLLETLSAHGFIRIHGTPQRFSLDYGVGRLGQAWLAGLDPVVLARPVVERLHAQTRETVSLALLRGHQHLYVMELPSPHVMSMARGIGPLDHLTRGASGKTILAFMGGEALDSVMRTAPKDVNKKAILRELAKIRVDGYWIARSEIFPGAIGIAAPTFDHAGCIAGSIIVFGPEVRFSEQKTRTTVQLVVEGAREISIAMGHVASSQPGPAAAARDRAPANLRTLAPGRATRS